MVALCPKPRETITALVDDLAPSPRHLLEMPLASGLSLSPQKCVLGLTSRAARRRGPLLPGRPARHVWSSGRGRPTASGPRPGPSTAPVSRTSAPRQAQRGSASSLSCVCVCVLPRVAYTLSGTSSPHGAGSHPQGGCGRRLSVGLSLAGLHPGHAYGAPQGCPADSLRRTAARRRDIFATHRVGAPMLSHY